MAEWLNRVGIILDCLAGFMLAPELLGLQGLKQLEQRLQNISLPNQRYFCRKSQKSKRHTFQKYPCLVGSWRECLVL